MPTSTERLGGLTAHMHRWDIPTTGAWRLECRRLLKPQEQQHHMNITDNVLFEVHMSIHRTAAQSCASLYTVDVFASEIMENTNADHRFSCLLVLGFEVVEIMDACNTHASQVLDLKVAPLWTAARQGQIFVFRNGSRT